MKSLSFFALVLLVASDATAQHRRGPSRRHPSPPSSTTSASTDLEPPSDPMPDADTLIQAIQAAAVAGNAEGAHGIAVLLLRGVPPRAAAAGLDALGVLARPEGSTAVVRFLQHRRPSLRRHAVAAAQAIHTPELVSALVARLGDSDEDVRVDAAVALGEVGGASAASPLFLAFERDLESVSGQNGGRLMHESAKSIARVGTPDDVQRLLGYLRRAPFRSMADALRAALARRDLPEPLKVHVVQAVGDLATRDVRDFLNSVVADAHGQDSAVVQAARRAAERIAE